ncbi:MAG: glutaredoxin family protein [Candidatus Diapherotrites archaeon]|nr:glutaredoxin family protein [Candidatus Diapherotrites archaeon]MDZ4256734.1 glutaredoxin family protein [archaeon]
MDNPKVTIYTTPTCIYCRLTKEFFRENHITYTEIDVAANAEAAQDMIKKSGQAGVPVIEVDGHFIVGFDKPALKKALQLT